MTRWATVRTERVVLAVARTVTATTRLLETLDLFHGDGRVGVVFAIDRTSEFSDGVAELLATVGAKVAPWSRLARTGVHLALTASENVNLREVRAPVVVLPHGVGFHKYVPDGDGSGVRLSGLVSARTLRDLDVRMILSHPDQAAQIEAVSAGAAARTIVAGDLCFDRLLASRRLRPAYRRALGIDDGRTLVVLSTTWRDQSLWARWRRLPERLLAELPVDEYQVALIAHPNVWSGHGPWQVRSWLADAREAGLLLVPPTAGWQATLTAADVVIGDHGSVTLYAASLGLPVLLAAFGEEVVPGTPLAELGRLAPALRPDAPLRPQVDRVLTEHDRDRYGSVATAAFDRVGEAAPALRAFLYERLDLPEPAWAPPSRAWPAPRPEWTPPRSYAVYTEVRGANVVSVRRRPAALDDGDDESATCLRHLACYDDEPDAALAESAAVIVRQPVSGDPWEWGLGALRQYPGAGMAVAATPDGCVAVLRDGTGMTVAGCTEVDPLLLGAVCYARRRTEALSTGEITLRLGDRSVRLRLASADGRC